LEEKERFFLALKDYGRDFDHITERVSSKNYEQVSSFVSFFFESPMKIFKNLIIQ
jgi:hypothetical protein